MKKGSAFPVRGKDRAVDLRLFSFQPAQQTRSEIKTDPGIIIDNIYDPLPLIQNASRCIRSIAFFGDSLIPVVKWRGRLLALNFFQPGILTGGLIKMAVNADVTFQKSLLF